uniref:hypothetical protein n=1 Tax=Globicatella sulfidifaciens TaxID=136093 RepID=UPI0023EF6FD3|nr:hypothetical protein [Globicatella sulfidifaciens]
MILINIPKSMVKPHAFDDGNKDTFYIRYGNTINNMRLDDLREMFKGREILERNILNFRDNRLSKLYSGEIIGKIGSKSLLTLHQIPEWSMGLNSFVSLKDLKENYKLDVFSPERYSNSNKRRGNESYNHDGLRLEAINHEGGVDSYTPVFYNGIIESVEIRMMNRVSNNGDSQPTIYRWDRFEEYLAIKIKELIEVILDYGIAKPIYIFVSLLNVKGKTATFGEWGD